MNELEKKAYAYVTDRQKDPNYPVYNWETEISDAYEQGYKDAVDKACEFFKKSMWEHTFLSDETYVVDGESSSISEFIRNFKKYMEEQQ